MPEGDFLLGSLIWYHTGITQGLILLTLPNLCGVQRCYSRFTPVSVRSELGLWFLNDIQSSPKGMQPCRVLATLWQAMLCGVSGGTSRISLSLLCSLHYSQVIHLMVTFPLRTNLHQARRVIQLQTAKSLSRDLRPYSSLVEPH